MRNLLVVASLLLWLPASGAAVEVPEYPQMISVNGSPVYYDPGSSSNYFFYDGSFWVYQADEWFTGAWFNGPWTRVAPLAVPVYLLRVPVRFFRDPPEFFREWSANDPPHWGAHWGAAWEARRRGWNRWERTSPPKPAPLPVYQREYEGSRYPAAEMQAALQERNYEYVPQEVTP